MLALAVTVTSVAGCASAPAPVPPSPPAAVLPLDGFKRVVVVASGQSRFSAAPGGNGQPAQGSSPPAQESKVFDEVMKWLPYTGLVPYSNILLPLAKMLYGSFTSFKDGERSAKTVPKDVSPAGVVAAAFAETVIASGGPSAQIVVTDQEPVGDFRKDADAIVRVAVPSWGVVRVQDGAPPLVGAFADVRAELVLRETGVILWKHEEDVTHPERLPMEAFTADRAATRERLAEVLVRAGRRMGNELVYALGRR